MGHYECRKCDQRYDKCDCSKVVVKEMHKKIGKITRTNLGFEDHGFFTAWLDMDFGHSSQGVGLFVMSGVNERNKPAVTVNGTGDFIVGILRACGVDRWEALKGRTIFVLYKDDSWGGMPLGIENLPTEDGEQFLFADWQAKVKLLNPKAKK